ncbi:MAG: CAP domain-containing protein [Xanthobacteraceae bacterium]|nr:CAP domain-containing protein [Xanthobacteraceae bacterium]
MLRAALAVVISAAVFGMGGCTGDREVVQEEPAFYQSMANGGAKLDAATAASMISGYRQNNGLGAVEVDPVLMRAAEAQAQAMAARNKMDHEVAGTLPKRLKAAGYDARAAVENISAGYHTLAEAFSGWRDSPPHRANMLNANVTKMGIAASYAPNTKYKVFWALILAAPDGAKVAAETRAR